LAGTGASLALYLVRRLDVVAGAHAVHGLMAGFVAPAAFAWVGDRSLLAGRGTAMGRIGAAIAAAAVLGPAAGGLLAQRVGAWAVFVSLSALAWLALLRTWRLAGASGGRAGREEVPAAEAGPGGRRAGGGSLLSPALLVAYAAAMVVQMGFGFLVWLLPLQAQAAGLGAGASGALMGVLGATAGLWMGLGGSVADRLPRRNVLGLGLLLLGLGEALLGAALDAGTFWIRAAAGAAVFGTGFGLIFPAAAALVVDATQAEGRGRAFSLFYIAFSAGSVAAPAAGGVLVRLGLLLVPQVPGGTVGGWWQTPYVLGVAAAGAAVVAALWPHLGHMRTAGRSPAR
ncbi:MAG: MFS transporter, partial [Bacillota bacterium]